MNKVAILVAVYNSSRYLCQCIDSLLSQTLKDIQIIAVDDCSTDGSVDILKNYASKDTRIKVITLPYNTGQAHARNVGLKYVDADYVCMVDSDDWLSRNALQSAVDVFENHIQVDSVLFKLIRYFEKDNYEEPYTMDDNIVLSGHDAFVESLTWNIHGLYMIRSSIHKKYPYDESSKLYSDDNTTRIHYLHSCEVRICDGVYYYRQHDSSMTHNVSVRRFDYLLANESMKRQLVSERVNDEIINIYENHRWLNIVGIYMFYFIHRKELSSDDRKTGLSIIHNAWIGVETDRLRLSLKCKFGYIPFLKNWKLFLIQENLYFFIRKMLGRI
jgi:glycosyltransferase involved in cell wall biosynthesis